MLCEQCSFSFSKLTRVRSLQICYTFSETERFPSPVAMSYSSQSRSSSSNRSLMSLSSQDRSQRASGGEIIERESDNTALTQPALKQHATPIPSLPSVEELNRMERWMALQERMAKLNNIRTQGHTYGKLSVTGNARAIRGNVCEDSTSLLCLRNHTYGNGDAKEGGMIWEGDISIAAFNDARRQGPNSR